MAIQTEANIKAEAKILWNRLERFDRDDLKALGKELIRMAKEE